MTAPDRLDIFGGGPCHHRLHIVRSPRSLMGEQPSNRIVAIALPAAWWLSRYVQSELHGVTATDPLTVVAAIAALTAVAMTAGMIPAMRAARIDPLTALRQD